MTVLFLRKSVSTWSLIAPKGHVLVEFHRVNGREGAMEAAKAWASSWSGYEIRFEDEQSEKRD